jgi:hypothetical protein
MLHGRQNYDPRKSSEASLGGGVLGESLDKREMWQQMEKFLTFSPIANCQKQKKTNRSTWPGQRGDGSSHVRAQPWFQRLGRVIGRHHCSDQPKPQGMRDMDHNHNTCVRQ